MKKFISVLLSIPLLFVSISPVLAINSTPASALHKEMAQARNQERNENIQEKLDDLRIIVASREANLKQKLALFRDKAKAQIIERINANLNRINSKRVEIANRFITNATRILDRLQQGVGEKASAGKDATKANEAILNARTKLASASAAVSTQSAMDYTITISSESGAKAEIKETRDKFHSDWMGVRKMLTDAKQAVANAIEVAATTLGGSK